MVHAVAAAAITRAAVGLLLLSSACGEGLPGVVLPEDGGPPETRDDLARPWSPADLAGSSLLVGDGGPAEGDLALPPFAGTCTSCHGTGLDPAPPRDLRGNQNPAAPGVGAHQAHLAPSSWHQAIACSECHVVPARPAWDPAVPTHLDGTVELVWGPLARAGRYQGLRCEGSYCHGATLAPDPPGAPRPSLRTPLWTMVDGTQAACGGACHGLPPGGLHPPGAADCAVCHREVIARFIAGNPPQVTWRNPALHIDGKVEVVDVNALSCTSCHGDAPSRNPAPPLGTHGEQSPREAAVGAHAQHLAPSSWHRSGQCIDCHAVPVSMLHANGSTDFAFGAPANARGASPRFDGVSLTCGDVYCHGASLLGPRQGGQVMRTPLWNQVDGTQVVCGSTCHTTPPGGTHPAVSDGCPICHSEVIASFTPGAPGKPPSATWADASRHIDGNLDVKLDCTSCHGDRLAGTPAPPRGTHGELRTSDPAVGAHAQHLLPSTWHRSGQCRDCHLTPGVMLHGNGQVDFTFAPPANAQGASPRFDGQSLTCAGTYCHGVTLSPPIQGGTVSRTPVWNVVDGKQDACGSTCHTNPPGGNHPPLDRCPLCHGDVISAYRPGNPPQATWANAQRHVDGNIDLKALDCQSCHGDPIKGTPEPPLGSHGETLTTQAAVGAHAQHLGASAWHRAGQCVDCHAVPRSMLHANGVIDLLFEDPANADGAVPAFDLGSLACSNVYCHGVTLRGPNQGGVVNRTPVWTRVDGSFKACGSTCHTTPPGAGHPASTACPLCHTKVIKTFVAGNPPTATWVDASLHIDGVVEVEALTCTSCHGDANSGNAAPPLGTHGETLTSQAAVGAHRAHLGPSTWHRPGECDDCHPVPSSTAHSNGVIDIAWLLPANAQGAAPLWNGNNLTCAGVYCHGATLRGAAQGGVVNRTPVWNVVDGRWDACGTTCHTNPPGGNHPASTDCVMCHKDVVQSYDARARTATWKAPALHIDGLVQSSAYHELAGWEQPRGNPNHHGSNYFLQNAQKDEHGVVCTQCHGAQLDGGSSGVSCFNNNCHPNLSSCTYCHGDARSMQANPPVGVGGEISTATLAVGRHAAHLSASSTHQAIACNTCHAVPPPADLSHTIGYQASADLQSAGHHGVVTLSGRAAGMSWDVAATVGNPATARGTCTGACHSDGRGGPPAVKPYWAGGTWNVGSCASCHPSNPSSGHHRDHGDISCVTCHPDAGSAQHLNGTVDVLSPIDALSIVQRGGRCGQQPTCNGNCHGQGHSNRCW